MSKQERSSRPHCSHGYPFANEEVVALSSTYYSDTGTMFFFHLPGSTCRSTDACAVKWLWRNLGLLWRMSSLSIMCGSR
ncbi:hypothetical protein ACHAW6_011347 [Cyclotella cf. meneghiniana]